MDKGLKIAFLLGSPDINGGTYVIYQHADGLRKSGNRVTIITEESVSPERYAWHPDADNLEWLTLEEAKKKVFDIVIATWWQSPFLLSSLTGTHYVYFVQSIESRFFEPADPTSCDTRDHDIWKELCESTYSLNLPVITEATWIKEYLYEHYNSDVFLVKNGIRKDVYKPEGEVHVPRVPGKLRVLIEGPVDVFYKNVPKSVELCREAGVDEVWLLTSSDIESFPGVDRVFSRIPIHDTPAIYRSCDVLVKLSYIEGMFGPPLEMFHCGGTSIVYDVTGYDEYIVHGENSFVAQRDDDEQIVAFLKELKGKPDVLNRLKQSAQETASAWSDWHKSTVEFESALRKIIKRPATSRNYLKEYTQKVFDANDPKLRSRDITQFGGREKSSGTDPDMNHNFVQLYWHSHDKFVQERSQWAYYQSGDTLTMHFKVEATGFPFWLRVDPSVRVGIIELIEISVKNTRTDTVVLHLKGWDAFQVLYLNGTVSWVLPGQSFLLSYADDPQLILPAVEEGVHGDQLEVEITLKEMGVKQFAVDVLHDKAKGNAQLMEGPNKKSILRRAWTKGKWIFSARK